MADYNDIEGTAELIDKMGDQLAAVLVEPYEQQFLYTPIFYLLGHFSKYVRPEAQRIGLEAELPENVHATAFVNTDDSIVAVIFNGNEDPVEISLQVEGTTTDSLLDGNAVQTILFPSEDE